MTSATFRPTPAPDGFKWRFESYYPNSVVRVQLRHKQWWRWPRVVDEEQGRLDLPVSTEDLTDEMKRLTSVLRRRYDGDPPLPEEDVKEPRPEPGTRGVVAEGKRKGYLAIVQQNGSLLTFNEYGDCYRREPSEEWPKITPGRMVPNA